MMSYEQINEAERKVIKKLRNEEKTLREIGRVLVRSASTIKRELDRNKGAYWYNPHEAQRKAAERRKNAKNRTIDTNPELRQYILNELKDQKSPDAIAGRLKLTQSAMRISHETIYQWIYEQTAKGSDVYKYLARGIKKRHRRANTRHSRCKIPDRVSIHKRPEEIEQRQTMGHWEGDTIVGSGRSGYVATLVERKSYYLAAALMENKKPETCNRAILEAFGSIENERIKTITFDNGSEFYQHSILKEYLECETYFADPYSSWQRGRNEHTNGILRRFFPKSRDFQNLSQNEIDEAVRKINNRPRKSLGYRTPYEVFFNLPVALQS